MSEREPHIYNQRAKHRRPEELKAINAIRKDCGLDPIQAEPKERTCLKCGRHFLSMGHRLCAKCGLRRSKVRCFANGLTWN